MLREAMKVAEQAILDHVECAQLFNFYPGANPAEFLETLKKNDNPYGIISAMNLGTRETMPNPALAITVVGGDGRSVIALNSTPSLSAFNYYGKQNQLTSAEGLAAIILHEFGHLISQQFGQSATQVVDDGDNDAKSLGNQTNVEQKCFPK